MHKHIRVSRYVFMHKGSPCTYIPVYMEARGQEVTCRSRRLWFLKRGLSLAPGAYCLDRLDRLASKPQASLDYTLIHNTSLFPWEEQFKNQVLVHRKHSADRAISQAHSGYLLKQVFSFSSQTLVMDRREEKNWGTNSSDETH